MGLSNNFVISKALESHIPLSGDKLDAKNTSNKIIKTNSIIFLNN